MAAGITIQAVVELETEETIKKFAEKEKRSFSAMAAILLEEAIEARERKTKSDANFKKKLNAIAKLS